MGRGPHVFLILVAMLGSASCKSQAEKDREITIRAQHDGLVKDLGAAKEALGFTQATVNKAQADLQARKFPTTLSQDLRSRVVPDMARYAVDPASSGISAADAATLSPLATDLAKLEERKAAITNLSVKLQKPIQAMFDGKPGEERNQAALDQFLQLLKDWSATAAALAPRVDALLAQLTTK